jgi:flavin reductase (DIM6/NTAB) family NADH-FMN oxidoreductase RutF
MIYTKQGIAQMGRVARLKLINAVSGVKPANLISTIDSQGRTNSAIISSVVHLGSNPPLLGFISRPQTAEVGHTYQNIRETGYYTISHIHPEFIKNAHYTSAKFPKDVSEFKRCNLTEEYVNDFKAPFVKESTFKMGLRFREAVDIKLNGTIMIIGEIEQLIIPDSCVETGEVDLEAINSVGISGLNSYYRLQKIVSYPYVRLNEVPDFNTNSTQAETDETTTTK